MHNNLPSSRMMWLAVMALSPLFSPNTYAAQLDSWYLGAKAGVAEVTGSCGTYALSCDDDPVSSGLFVGYVVNDSLAFEVSYDHFSEFTATYPAQGTSGHSAAYESDLSGFSFVAKPYLQVSDSWSLFGKAGVMLWEMDVTDHEPDWTREMTHSNASPLLGIGVGYRFNRNWHAALEYQWLGQVTTDLTSSMDINAVNLSIIYQFASKPLPEPEAVSAPACIEAVPSQSAIEEQAMWSFDGITFASNSTVLSTQLELALQPALQRLLANPQAHLNIYGHTDSVGSAYNNMQLSERRAQSIQTYFIQHGVPAVQLTVKGFGESQPLADNRTEVGRSKNRRVELVSPAFYIRHP
ncbi:hypothetical protein C3737_22125 [Aeromonas jandaei]|uniref:OmpA family protein n=1 Tax=Aeromonas jandaei TaxID=650 RepID=UPI000CE1D8BF|nr:OmpA family protein [Aeromonas jandaei]PPA27887.1 hypothetical protein C3737_22125 [Aeromonas jandaei]